jgi:NADP-dependent 3-hydroxy acid dehydrogenase YdfG
MLAVSGARVIAGARQRPEGDGSMVIATTLDVADEASVQAFAELAVKLGVDTLVNNAGTGFFGLMEDATVDDYHRVMNTNVLGTLLVTRSLIPEFRRRHQRGLRSQLVNVTSDVSARTFPGGSIYTASKHAQRALTQTTAHEGESYGLRVTEVRPGMTDTHFNGRTPGDPERSQHLRPDDVASAILYALAAPQHLRVDEIVVHPTVQPVVF